jgi:hypothetical protein
MSFVTVKTEQLLREMAVEIGVRARLPAVLVEDAMSCVPRSVYGVPLYWVLVAVFPSACIFPPRILARNWRLGVEKEWFVADGMKDATSYAIRRHVEHLAAVPPDGVERLRPAAFWRLWDEHMPDRPRRRTPKRRDVERLAATLVGQHGPDSPVAQAALYGERTGRLQAQGLGVIRETPSGLVYWGVL